MAALAGEMRGRTVIRLSIPLRQALSRLSLPVLIAAAFGTMLLGKADALLAERARMALADVLTPIWAALREPVGAVRDAVARGRSSCWRCARRMPGCARRTSGCAAGRPRRWRWRRRTTLLRRQLAFVPEAAPAFQTARVVADGGGTYARAVLLAAGPHHGVRKGQVALDERGLVGRVTEVGQPLRPRAAGHRHEHAHPRDAGGQPGAGHHGRHQRRPAAPAALARGRAARARASGW